MWTWFSNQTLNRTVTQPKIRPAKTHAYTEWIDPESGKTNARMLYDHRVDPEENTNISENAENKKLVTELHEKLHHHINARDKIVIP